MTSPSCADILRIFLDAMRACATPPVRALIIEMQEEMAEIDRRMALYDRRVREFW
jgi:hypothetical protein